MDKPTPVTSLLAAKGGARPAMRPPFQPLRAGDSLARSFVEDPSWADQSGEIAADPDAGDEALVLPIEDFAPATNVRFIRRDLAFTLTRVAPTSLAAARPRRRAFDQNRKAAFTLRIDAERHARLRLACTAANRSAQAVLTEALDRLIGDITGADSRPQRT